jgi:hypothetical protein
MTTRVPPQLLDQSSGIGYTPGVGGSVTQATNKTTAVTLNKPCGSITLAPSSLAAGAAATFLFNNSLAGENDVLALSAREYGGSNENHLFTSMARFGGGAFFITVRNMSGAPVAEAVVVNFALIKAAVT